ncbi:MAG: FtsX-like permease family protein [Bacteroidaceae bacterium]
MVNFPFYIARRYLFSKKSHHTINVISGISVVGVALATLALVCTLSVFNGFHDLVATLFTSIDPELKITPTNGKTILADDTLLLRVRQMEGVEACSESLEDHALVRYNGQQAMVTIKGVDESFNKVTNIQDILYGEGRYVLRADVLDYGVLGIQLASLLGTGSRFPDAIEVYAPRKGERINMTNPTAAFNQESLFSPGVVFTVDQKKYDANYIITSISFARRLFEQQGCISSLEVKVKPSVNTEQVKEQLREMLGSKYEVKNRYEQQDDVFRIMEIEKYIAYLFLSFILVVACFNLVGSLSMLIIDKKDDVETLRHLGADDHQISRIFLFEGRLICTIGAVLGIGLGLLLCYLQMTFGLLRLGDASGNFIVDAYPVSVHADDILLIFVTVLVVGYLSVWYPVRYLSKRLL